jgi:RNA polymerase sigma-70 factor (ECF subfamily)
MEPASAAPGDFERLYREMLPTVHRFASTRLGEAEAEDLAAEVFHAAVVAYGDGREHQVTPAWIMAVARNKVIDRWRSAERRSAIALRNRVRKDDLVTFPADWSHDERRDDVLAALDRMRPAERSLMVLHYLDGMTAAALSEVLECSVSAVESRLARARRSFRTNYQPERRR